MDWEEADEFFYFNQIRAWVGETTPCFLALCAMPPAEEEGS